MAIFEGPRPDFCGHFGQKFGIFDRTFDLKIPKIGAGLPAYYQGSCSSVLIFLASQESAGGDDHPVPGLIRAHRAHDICTWTGVRALGPAYVFLSTFLFVAS